MRISSHIFQTIQEHLENLPFKVLYIFGSFGTARQHPGSDLDLALLPSIPLNPVHLFELANILSTRLNREVDLVDLSTASTVMAKEVIRTGERLIINDLSTTKIFEMRTLADYARLNEERQPVLAELTSPSTHINPSICQFLNPSSPPTSTISKPSSLRSAKANSGEKSDLRPGFVQASRQRISK
jgi:predicted nucleotidyltransferase